MTALDFTVTGARVEPYAAVPTLAFALRIDGPADQRIQTVALNCQIRIEPGRRTYTADEGDGLRELFGDPVRWGETQQPFLWTHVTTMVPRFTGSTTVDLFVPCSYDLEVAAARYLHAVRDGEIPLVLLFSGSVFAPAAGGTSVTQIAWDREAHYRLPVAQWREVMDAYYPGRGWLRLSRDTIDRLGAFKERQALPTWDGAVDALLDRATVAAGGPDADPAGGA